MIQDIQDQESIYVVDMKASALLYILLSIMHYMLGTAPNFVINFYNCAVSNESMANIFTAILRMR